MADEKKRTRITSQKVLASLVPCHPITLSKAKNIKGYMSVEKYATLSQLTKIDQNLWAFGSRRKLASELRAFFKRQKFGY